VDGINYDILASDVYDDPTTHKNAKSVSMNKYESVLGMSDIVFANSKHMQKKVESLCSNRPRLLPNAISSKYIQDVSVTNSVSTEEADELTSIPKPRVCYVGSLNYSLNVDLLRQIISDNRDLNFVFIGNPTDDFIEHVNSLKNNFDNTFFLGHVIHSRLPRLIRKMDILISVKDPVTCVGNDSLKIYEYLASSNPIVTTPVNPAAKFSDVVYVARSPSEFSSLLRKALNEESDVVRTKRQEAAHKHTWSKRAEKIVDGISSL